MHGVISAYAILFGLVSLCVTKRNQFLLMDAGLFILAIVVSLPKVSNQGYQLLIIVSVALLGITIANYIANRKCNRTTLSLKDGEYIAEKVERGVSGDKLNAIFTYIHVGETAYKTMKPIPTEGDLTITLVDGGIESVTTTAKRSPLHLALSAILAISLLSISYCGYITYITGNSDYLVQSVALVIGSWGLLISVGAHTLRAKIFRVIWVIILLLVMFSLMLGI